VSKAVVKAPFSVFKMLAAAFCKIASMSAFGLAAEVMALKVAATISF